MIAPPATFASAAVSPRVMLYRSGDIERSRRIALRTLCFGRRPKTDDRRRSSSLAAVPHVHHVAIFGDVVLALQAQRAARARFGFRPGFQQLVPMDSLSADEVLFEIGVDGARRVYRARV